MQVNQFKKGDLVNQIDGDGTIFTVMEYVDVIEEVREMYGSSEENNKEVLVLYQDPTNPNNRLTATLPERELQFA